jgi:thymidylate synthase (FAD)
MTIPTDALPLYNNGYVRLTKWMNSEKDIVDFARVSFNKESSAELSSKDVKLIEYLGKHGHRSPTRAAVLTFETRLPLMVQRQLFKYKIGQHHVPETEGVLLEYGNGDDGGLGDVFFNKNEISYRYNFDNIEFYIPDKIRAQAKDKKQGSAGLVDEKVADQFLLNLENQIIEGMAQYEWAIAQGVAIEQARLLIPSAYGLMIRSRWICSLDGLLLFLEQRLSHDAQDEIRQLAEAVYKLVEPLYPNVMKSFLKLKI